MASFLHVAPGGMRFNGPDLGAWYAAAALATAVAEVAHHLRREAVATAAPVLSRRYRTYTSILAGSYLDLRGQQAIRPEVYAGGDYAAAQALGESLRTRGGCGVLFDSLRHAGGLNIAAHRPRNILDVTQAGHYEISVRTDTPRIEARRLAV
jgi:RES domain-containing protein